MKIAVSQPQCRPGRIAHNVKAILHHYQEALAQQADLFIVPRPMLTAATHHEAPLSAAAKYQLLLAHQQLAQAAQQVPILLTHPDATQTLLFYLGAEQQYTSFKTSSWGMRIHFNELLVLLIDPAAYSETAEQGRIPDCETLGYPDAIVSCADDPFSPKRYANALVHATLWATLSDCPVVTTHSAGVVGSTVLLGGSGMVWPNGSCQLMPPARGLLYVLDTDMPTAPAAYMPKGNIEVLYSALVGGLKDFMANAGLHSAIIGLSGGIDSALVAEIATRALGQDNVLAVMLPSEFTSSSSIDDAEILARNLGIRLINLPIDSIRECLLSTLEPHFEGRPPDTTEENLQARTRALLLMALSNKLGHALLNTSNKSEAAVGYSTLYGDMCGAISVIGDIFKTDVYSLARWINRHGEFIPNHIITRAPSAELRPDQTDQDSLPDYATLDRILRLVCQGYTDCKTLVARGEDPDTAARVLGLLQGSAFKRYQMPPILRVQGDNEMLPTIALGARWPF